MKTATAKNRTLKTCLLVSALTGAIMVSTNANANALPLEQAITQAIAAQGQKVMNEVRANLQKNIQQEINTFSIDAAWQWLMNDEQAKNTKNEAVTNNTNK